MRENTVASLSVDLVDGKLNIMNGGEVWLAPLTDTARNLMHEIARLLGDRCPCHHGQQFNRHTGLWKVIS